MLGCQPEFIAFNALVLNGDTAPKPIRNHFFYLLQINSAKNINRKITKNNQNSMIKKI